MYPFINHNQNDVISKMFWKNLHTLFYTLEFADNNNLIPMKVFRRGIFGRRLRDEVFYKAIRYMRAGKADALIVTNLDAISDGIADSYLKIGAVREAGYRLFSVDEKEPKVDLYIPPKRGDLQ